MTITQVLDHASEAVEKLLAQFVGKERMEALLSALVRQLNAIETDVFAMLSQQTIAGAEGAQLDGIGSMIGVTRGGRVDADYREAITREVLVRTSQGSAADLINVSLDIVEGWNVEIVEPANARAEFEAFARRVSDGEVIPFEATTGGPGWTQEEFDAVFLYLDRARSAGVNFVLLARTEPATITPVAWEFTAGGTDPADFSGSFVVSGETYQYLAWNDSRDATLTVDVVGTGACYLFASGRGGNGGSSGGGGGGNGGTLRGRIVHAVEATDVWTLAIGDDVSLAFDGDAEHNILVPAGGNGANGTGVAADVSDRTIGGLLGARTIRHPGAGGSGSTMLNPGGSSKFGFDGGDGGDIGFGGGGGAGVIGDGGDGTGVLPAAGAGGIGEVVAGIFASIISAAGYATSLGGGGGGGGHGGATTPGAGGGAGSAAGIGTDATAPGAGGGAGGGAAAGGAGFIPVFIIAYSTTGTPVAKAPFAFDGEGGATFDGDSDFQIMTRASAP